MKDSDPYTGGSSDVETNHTHRRTRSTDVGVDEDTVPIPQTAFKKFYDSVFGPTAAGADANAGTAGTQSSLGPGTGRAIPVINNRRCICAEKSDCQCISWCRRR